MWEQKQPLNDFNGVVYRKYCSGHDMAANSLFTMATHSPTVLLNLRSNKQPLECSVSHHLSYLGKSTRATGDYEAAAE